jgi:hypothetical protein
MKTVASAFLALGTAAGLSAPASAVDFITNYALTFENGVAYATSSPSRTVPGTYRDIFTFTVATSGSFSGSLTTQRLRADNGNGSLGSVISDLDFTNVVLDSGNPFRNPTPGTDTVETLRLPSTIIGAGTHMLFVDYTVQVASPSSGAGYSGPLNFAATTAVPEPTQWAMFIAGFGMIGAAMRANRRRPARVTFNRVR